MLMKHVASFLAQKQTQAFVVESDKTRAMQFVNSVDFEDETVKSIEFKSCGQTVVYGSKFTYTFLPF